MNEKQFDRLKKGSIILNEKTKEKYTVLDKDELGVVLSDGTYYLWKQLIDFIIIKK